MQLNGQHINTPGDNPIGYALDWRWQVAQAAIAIAAGGGRIPWIKDPDARKLTQHLQHRQTHPLKDNEKPTAFDLVIGWHESPAAGLIEAFLLASDTCDDAAGELALPVDDIRLYGRLWYDIWDNQGMKRPAVLMRLRGTPDADADDPAARLRRIALASGIHGLRQVLHTGGDMKEPSLDDMVQVELKRRLHAGELRTSDLIRLQANTIARERIAAEEEDDDLRWLEGWQFALKLLRPMAPKLIGARKLTPAEATARTEEIQARIKSQKNISATPVMDDPDKGYEALTRLMRTNFTPPESRVGV